MKKKVILITVVIIFIFSIICCECYIVFADKNDYKVPILLYHNITLDNISNNSTVHISLQEFEENIKILKENGYEGIFFDEYLSYRKEGTLLPPKPIIITFDDGYRSNYEYAFPILEKYNIKATIFVVTGRVGAVKDVTYPHFTWSEALEMVESNIIDIQSHSDFHKNMLGLSKAEAELELRRSRYLIERKLKKRCNVFAYPYGLSNNRLKKMAKKAGYEIQVLVGDKGVNTLNDNLNSLKRLTVRNNIGAQGLIDMIQKNMNQ